MSHEDELFAKIKILNETIWEDKVKEPLVREWLSNFSGTGHGTESERTLHALYLLSQFTYFGGRQMREMLRVLFRDLFRYPIVEKIRKSNGDTTNLNLIEREFKKALDDTLFLGVGNPSESGCHLLYYFRQENGLPKNRFIHSHEVFRRKRPKKWRMLLSTLFNWRDRYAGTLAIRNPNVTRYVFIDDFCGSGHQAQIYSSNIVDDIKAFNPNVDVYYFVLCGTSKGMDAVRTNTSFDFVECVFELDESFRCFSPKSRYFPSPKSAAISATFAEQMCRDYGSPLFAHPLGYDDRQLLLSFQHNTPDNTLPVFWSDESGWTPVFRRYPKLYG